jgi:hypothetical protein
MQMGGLFLAQTAKNWYLVQLKQYHLFKVQLIVLY